MNKILSRFLSIFDTNTPGRYQGESNFDNVTDELRSQILNLNPHDIGLSRDHFDNNPWGLLMETGYPEGTATLVAIADGTTSLYFGNGGGIIGAGEHECVYNASMIFLATANRFVSHTQQTNHYPYASVGEVLFYFLTFNGVSMQHASEEVLGEGEDELSLLFYAGHDVIGEIRRMEESGDS